jgi:hypothetical protein
MSKEELKLEINELELKLQFLNQGIDYITKLIYAESKQTLLPTDELTKVIAQAAEQEEEVNQKLAAAKNQILEAKARIVQKKQVYEHIDDELKKDNWSILTDQVGDDHSKITDLQALIGELEKEKFGHYQYRVQLEQRLAMMKATENQQHLQGADPRLHAALTERETLTQQLTNKKNIYFNNQL